jgi:hypothetical protein
MDENNNNINNDNTEEINNQNINEKKPQTSTIQIKNKKSKKGGMKELAYKFPMEASFSKVEIPFAFQNNIDQNSQDNKFHSYIKIKDTPTLYLDISTDNNIDKLFLSSAIEDLKVSNSEKEKQLNLLEKRITSINNENDSIKEEIKKLKDGLLIQKKTINNLQSTIKTNEENNQKLINKMKNKLSEKKNIYNNLKEKYELYQIKNNNNENLNKEEYLNSIFSEIKKLDAQYLNSIEYYSKKFSLKLNDDEYIINSLQIDLIDFEKYIKEKLKIIKPKINELINLIQNSVNLSIGEEYEVKLYGSHATNLCLPWSDLDVVLCKKNNNIENNYKPLHDLYLFLKEKNYFKLINYIGATTVPLIKIYCKNDFMIKSVDISLQDPNHYGIQCVSLVTSLINEYEVLRPMVLALKHILKQANLNDPYKVKIILLIL